MIAEVLGIRLAIMGRATALDRLAAARAGVASFENAGMIMLDCAVRFAVRCYSPNVAQRLDEIEERKDGGRADKGTKDEDLRIEDRGGPKTGVCIVGTVDNNQDEMNSQVK